MLPHWVPSDPVMRAAGFYAPLKSSLVLAQGVGAPTYARATDGTFYDFEGLLKTAIAGEARFTGARRVKNYVKQDFSQFTATGITLTSGVSDPAGGTTAYTITATTANGIFRAYYSSLGITTGTSDYSVQSIYIRRRTGTGNILSSTVPIASFTDITSTVTTGWQRVMLQQATSIGAGGAIGLELATSGDAVDIWWPQVELTNGQANQNPSEYVSYGAGLSYPYHGAGADGVQYFEYENGNTVTSNVVTEGFGAPIPTSVLGRMRFEYASTNVILYSDQMDIAPWIVSAGTTITANTTTAPDGSNTAETVTFAGGGTVSNVYQSSSITTALAYTQSIYLKEGTQRYVQLIFGAAAFDPTTYANFDLQTGTIGNYVGTLPTIEAVAFGFYRITYSSTSTATASAPLINLVAVNSLTSPRADPLTASYTTCYAWGAQGEQNSSATSYIKTTGGSVTRNADLLTYPTSGNFSDTSGTVYVEFSIPAYGTTQGIVGTGGGAGPVVIWTTHDIRCFDGTNFAAGVGAPTLNTLKKVGTSWSGSTSKIISGATASALITYDGSWNLSSIYIGFPNFLGNIGEVRIWLYYLSDAIVSEMTT